MATVPTSPSRAELGSFESLADVFKSNHTAAVVEAHIRSLHPSAVQEIVSIFASPPRNSSTIQVLRALWCCAALRPSILHVFSSASFGMGGYEERLLDEVDLLLAGDARDGTKSAQIRVQTISMCATAVCRQANDQESLHAGPLLVCCARAAAQVRTKRGRSVERRILKYLLSCLKKPSNLRLKLIVAILDSGMKMDMEDEISFLHALDSFVALRCEDRELPAIFRATVTSLGRARKDRQISILGLIALNILRKTSLGSLSNVLDILGTMIMDSEVVCRRLVDAISCMVRSENKDAEFLCEQTRLGPSHISVMYFLASTSSQNVRELVSKLLQRIISDAEVTFDTSHLASSSSSTAGSQFFRAFALLNNTKIPAVLANGETIATVFEGQVWSQRVGSQTWGARMLFEAFVLIPRSRGKILSAIFTALTNVDTPEAVIHAFCGLLEHICDNRKSALHLRDFGVQVQNLLNCVDYIPLRVDCEVVAALSRLSMTIPCLTNQMLLFLRKATGSRLLKLQRVACAGFLAVIEHSTVSEDTRLDACTTLGNIIEWSDSPVRAHLILLLIRFLDRNPDHSGHIRSLSELVVRPLTVIVEKLVFRQLDPLAGVAGEQKGSQCIVDPSKSLEGPAVECLARDDLRLLLRLCDKLRSHDESIQTFLFKLTDYLGDVKQVAHDACTVRDAQSSISTRVAQLCTLYETMFCIDARRFSPSHVRAYAVCLLIRDSEISKARCGNSSPGILATPRSHSEVEMFASISAREAVSSELSGLYDTNNQCEMSLMDSVEALRVLSCNGVQDVFRGVVQREIMRLILAKLRGNVLMPVIDSSEENEFVQLLNCLKQCFVATCPWRDVNYCRHHETRGARLKTSEVAVSAADASRSHDKQSSSVQSACQCAELEQSTSDFLSTINLPIADVDNGVGQLQVFKVTKSLPSSIRQFSLAILVEVLSKCEMKSAWSFLRAFMRDSLHPQKASTNHASLGRNQENEKHGEGNHEIHFSPGRNTVLAESAEQTETVVALARIFCLEFEHSLSTALTMSYLDLFSCLLEAVEENRAVTRRIREVICTTITEVFRDYSIRQSRILRGMMTLLLKSFEEKSGLEFCASLIRWLGSDAAIHRSETMRTGEINGRIGVEDFDIDILEEAIVSDTQRDHDSHLNASCQQERGSDHSRPHSGTLCHEEDIRVRDGSAHLSQIPETDLVKTLCLNEGEESAVWSISCVLGYFGHLVRRFLEIHRRSTKDGFLEGNEYMDVLTGIVNAIAELFRTPFVETPAPTKSRMLLPIWKRLGDLMQDLLEIAEFQLRLIMADLRKFQGLMESSFKLASLSRHILGLLFKDEKTKLVLSAPQLADQRSRIIFLQEKLDATATAFLLCTSHRTANPLEDLRLLLQARIRQIGTLTIAENGGEDINGGFHARARFQSRPKKRQCVRSRNRYVDGWLREENGDDNFVDLEDFIVPVDVNY